MALIELDDRLEICVIHSQGDGIISLTIAENKVSKGMVLLDANRTALLIRELRSALLSMTE